ncbi:MAG: hypothetical protein J6M44_06500, partial [Butyrivibrio sp.]|nr:hypothetical protein [Butyrivibrio sp.]
ETRPNAPTGLTTENATLASAKDGKIKDTTTAMEYKLKEGSDTWTGASENETAVAPGVYLVRTKATNDKPAGKTTEVKVITAAQYVENLINALPEAEGVKTTDKTKIEEARTEYNKLNSEQQEEVSDTAKAKLEADEVALVKKLIEELPAASDVKTTDKDAIEAARNAYDVLTDEQKTQVGDTLKEKLEAVEAALLIVGLPEASAVTADKKADIEAARKVYDALNDEQKEQIGDDLKAKLEAAEVALVKKLIEELPDPSAVTSGDADQVAAAKKAYDNLTADQKKEITEDEKDKLDAVVQALSDSAVSDVEALIKALPVASSVTADKEADIKAASEAFDALDKDQQALVKTTLKNKLAADKVALAIVKLPETSAIDADDAEAIEAARAAYDKLTAAQKGSVGTTLKDKLVAAETALSENLFNTYKTEKKTEADGLVQTGDSAATEALKEAAKKAIDDLNYDTTKTFAENKAAVDAIINNLKKDLEDQRAIEPVIAAINALPGSEDVDVDDKAAIEAARKAYYALKEDQKKKIDIDILKRLTDAEDALAAVEKEAEDTEAAKKVTDVIDALPATDKVAATDKATIEAARKAYDALIADQKKKVPA